MAVYAPSPEPATTFDEQIALLQERGLTIEDRDKALRCLSHCAYYRLIAYRAPIYDRAQNRFKEGATFTRLWEFYAFDRDLRQLLLEAGKRLEISLRANWTYVLAHRIGPQAFEDSGLHKDPEFHAKALARLDQDLDQCEDVGRHRAKGEKAGQARPPIWACSEAMSFGLLSSFYGLIGPYALKDKIANAYGFSPDVFQTLVYQVSYLRNLSAHHVRVWDRHLTVTLTLPIVKGPPEVIASLNRASLKRLYNTLVMLSHVVRVVDPDTTWPERTSALIKAQNFNAAAELGFPDGWQEMPIWKLK